MNEPLPKKVHGKLRARLASGALPPGSRLDYKSLARELGVSTTPVREAVSKLASEGFVELVPRLGAVVRSLSRNTAQELFEVREALESFAAAKAAKRMSAKHLAQLKKHLEAMRVLLTLHNGNAFLSCEQADNFLTCDEAFHQTILAGAHNPALTRAMDESQGQLRLFLTFCKAKEISRLSQACDEHQEIVDALDEHDATRASDAMSKHIRKALQITLDHLDTMHGDGFAG